MNAKKSRLGICFLAVCLLVYFASSAAGQELALVEKIGTLEVFHLDDFQHPENSRFVFYLNVNGEKFTLESREPLPVVISGTRARVKGNLEGNKIYVQEVEIDPIENQEPAAVEEEKLAVTEVNDTLFGFRLNWYYAAIPLAAILGMLVYVETKRRISHARLLAANRNNKSETLKNYARDYTSKGYSREQIKNSLLKYGYSAEQIEEAFKEMKH